MTVASRPDELVEVGRGPGSFERMKTIIPTATLLLVTSTLACSGDADIGADADPVFDLAPVACSSGPTAEVDGSVADPDTGTAHAFGAASATAIGHDTGSAVLSLGDGNLSLRVSFSCQTHAPGTYQLVADGQQEIDCPTEVLGAVIGAIEYLPAESGTVIVDDSGNCLAGRFRAGFGDRGELIGWFRAPWQPAP